MNRAYYSNHIDIFLKESENSILGELIKHHEFDLTDLQRNAWISQIRILKDQFNSCNDDIYIFFEFAIPRMGKRVDVILLYKGTVFVIEFKVGDDKFANHAID